MNTGAGPAAGSFAGMDSVRLQAADGATAALSPFGAQLLSWCPAGAAEQLFVSPRAVFDGRTPIRGGVPLVFPQFADQGPLPAHGFARTSGWTLAKQGHGAQGAHVRLTLNDDPRPHTLWPQAFEASYSVHVHGSALQMRLQLRNRGSRPWAFQAALHTYLAVQDLHALRLTGLEGRPYRERGSPGRSLRQADAALAVAGELDRIYPDAPPMLTLHEPGRSLQISQRGFADTVVWNPGPVRSAAIADLGPHGHLHMLCVEAATIVQPVTLAAGQEWTGTQRLQLI